MNGQDYGTLLSVCIPVYNWDIRPFAQRLTEELESEGRGKNVEIIIMDDASLAQDLKVLNREFISAMKLENLKYEELEENRGRTRMRNLLGERAGGSISYFRMQTSCPIHITS